MVIESCNCKDSIIRSLRERERVKKKKKKKGTEKHSQRRVPMFSGSHVGVVLRSTGPENLCVN